MESSHYRNSEARLPTNGYPFEYSCTSLKLSIEALLDETKHVVTEKKEIEYGDLSKLLAHLVSPEYENSAAQIKKSNHLID